MHVRVRTRRNEVTYENKEVICRCANFVGAAWSGIAGLLRHPRLGGGASTGNHGGLLRYTTGSGSVYVRLYSYPEL